MLPHINIVYCLYSMPGILIVDDNASIRHLLRVFVETQTQFTVCGEARHGVDGIQRAKELNPDLILLDLSMPVLGGAEAASVLRKELPWVKIVLFSMHTEDVPKTVAAKIGVDLTLSKIDGIAKLPEHLKQLLSSGAHPGSAADARSAPIQGSSRN